MFLGSNGLICSLQLTIYEGTFVVLGKGAVQPAGSGRCDFEVLNGTCSGLTMDLDALLA